MSLPFSTAALLGGLAMGIFSAYLAGKRGKNPYFWFCIGFLFGIFGVMAIFFAPREKKKEVPLSAPKPAPPSIPGPTHKFWYYLDPEHRQQGPMSHGALTLAWREGKITTETYVWNEELPEWKPIGEIIM